MRKGDTKEYLPEAGFTLCFECPLPDCVMVDTRFDDPGCPRAGLHRPKVGKQFRRRSEEEIMDWRYCVYCKCEKLWELFRGYWRCSTCKNR